MDDKDGTIHTKFTNISSDDFELILKGCGLVLFLLDSSEDLVLTSILVDNNCEEPPLSCLDLSSREDYW